MFHVWVAANNAIGCPNDFAASKRML